jgi:hypothetical protein
MLLGLGPAKVAIGILRTKIACGLWVMMMITIITPIVLWIIIAIVLLLLSLL